MEVQNDMMICCHRSCLSLLVCVIFDGASIVDERALISLLTTTLSLTKLELSDSCCDGNLFLTGLTRAMGGTATATGPKAAVSLSVFLLHLWKQQAS
jgi:hypothetical protein